MPRSSLGDSAGGSSVSFWVLGTPQPQPLELEGGEALTWTSLGDSAGGSSVSFWVLGTPQPQPLELEGGEALTWASLGDCVGDGPMPRVAGSIQLLVGRSWTSPGDCVMSSWVAGSLQPQLLVVTSEGEALIWTSLGDCVGDGPMPRVAGSSQPLVGPSWTSPGNCVMSSWVAKSPPPQWLVSGEKALNSLGGSFGDNSVSFWVVGGNTTAGSGGRHLSGSGAIGTNDSNRIPRDSSSCSQCGGTSCRIKPGWIHNSERPGQE
jgi:hypothetical protein